MKTFSEYDQQNPKIWEYFKKYSFEAKKKGLTHYGAKSIFEIIRWHSNLYGNDGFKLNNNYTSMYARKMIKEHPEFKGFFKLRKINK